MKKFVIRFLIITVFIFLGCFITTAFSANLTVGGIGAVVYKDGNKCYITNVLPDSPAEKASLQAGSELLQIGNTKVKNLSLGEIQNLIRGNEGTEINILVKNNGQEKLYKIKRKVITVPRSSDRDFAITWYGSTPIGYENVIYAKIFPHYSTPFKQFLTINNYWVQRKESFRKIFPRCQSLELQKREACYTDLVLQEIEKTDKDATKEHFLPGLSIENDLEINLSNLKNLK